MIGVLAVVPKGVPGNSLYPVAKRLVTALPEFNLTDNALLVHWRPHGEGMVGGVTVYLSGIPYRSFERTGGVELGACLRYS